jgi:integrating conjugative element protein (TIGR03749 family)
MNAHIFPVFGWLAILPVLAIGQAHAQAVMDHPATLELGEVGEDATPPRADVTSVGAAAARQGASGAGSPPASPAPRAPVQAPAADARSARPTPPVTPRSGTPATARSSAGADATSNLKPERLEFKRRPLRIILGSTERLVTFPNPVAISLPSGAETVVDLQIIGRTAYLTMAAPRSAPIRVLAEDLVTGRTIPLDLLGAEAVDGLSTEIEVHYADEELADLPAAAPADEPPVLHMVQLTRHAVQTVYAPRRLKPAVDGVHGIPIDNRNVEGLFRGVRTRGRPLGQWRSGDLYVTAVQVVNLEQRAVTLDLEQVRGQWIAATLQHPRVLAAGSDRDNTTLYLVCGQPFDACR